MIALALRFDVCLLLFQSRSSPYESEKEKKRRWVFGRHKLKRLTSQSTLVERSKSAEKKVKPEGFLVGQEID
ncbi:hypothetical protein L1987_64638 [Smallanthus sonchifolius]|uniref:Uncharacterized protein n=1 Tax=Smallanthus sonchifolius TaxID=185202 RepID=A0ACB9BS79_9ASTR|nr:hypothetical protein L1987_64638 [Smallanthus sonchifolius]